MNGSAYRKLRKQSTKDDRKAAKKEKEDRKYSNLKAEFVAKFARFNSNDDLFDLVGALHAGVMLLDKMDFPADEYIDYEKRKK